jgi:hypothetical protein
MLKEERKKVGIQAVVLGYVGQPSLARANQEARMVAWVNVHSMLVLYPEAFSSNLDCKRKCKEFHPWFRTRLIHKDLYASFVLHQH